MIKIKPIFSEKIWGGSNLNKLGFEIPSTKTGEAWIVSAYKNNESMTDLGINLRELYETKKELFNNYNSEEFPLLIKILDAEQDLSIQVHPNDQKALELENYEFGKHECWYILDSKKNTNIIIDIKVSNKLEAEELISKNEWDKLLNIIPIKNGDSFEIQPGTVHAIKSGTLLYELQQSSDITYRLYDYDRLDNDGNKRPLDIEKSLEVINYNSKDYKRYEKLINNEFENILRYSIINNKLFSLEKWVIKNEQILNFDKNEKNFLLITLIEGELAINLNNIKKYESALITANELNKIDIKGNGILLVANPN